MTLFPYKLHELLTEMQSNAHLSSIISWMPSGNAFKIHQPELFEVILLQKYFPRQTQINSFKRQLLYYGFDNLGEGIFAHPCFLKDKRHLCGQITHTNPTKSQREANTSIPSRRVRGKRAKQALRQNLAKVGKAEKTNKKRRASPSISPLPETASPLTVPSAQISAPPSPLESSPTMMSETQTNLRQVLHQANDKPIQYWDRLNGMPFVPQTHADLTALQQAMAMASSKGLPSFAPQMAMLPINIQAQQLGLSMPQPYGPTSSYGMFPKCA